jgi:hypothetical protein
VAERGFISNGSPDPEELDPREGTRTNRCRQPRGGASYLALTCSFRSKKSIQWPGDQFPDRGSFYRLVQLRQDRRPGHLDSGTEFIGKPEDWGKKQVEDYEANRYHQPSDEYDPSWNYEGMIEDAQLGFYAGLAIANTPQLPAWNPGDEFEAARKKALAAVGKGR